MTHPNRVFAARADLISFHPEFSMTVEGAEFVAGLLEDARALWAVRVLDAWALAGPGREVHCFEADNGTAYCRLVDVVDLYREDLSDFHAARLAAAEAVFPTLDAATRAKLGEKP